MRVIVGAAVGLRLERDLAALLPLQYEDGGWEPGWIYKYGSSGIKIGNRGLTTALALNAIAALYPPQPLPQTLPQQEKQERKMQELDKEKEKKLRTGESFCTVEITPLPKLPVTSVIHGSTTTGLSLPLPQMRRRTWKVTLSMTALAKGFFTFLFSRNGSPLLRQG